MTKRWLPWLAAGIILLAGAISLTWQWRKGAQQAARLAQLAAENQQLRARLEAATRISPEPRPAREAPRAEEHASVQKGTEPLGTAESATTALTIQGLQDNLTQANASITALQSQIQDLQAQMEKVTAQNKRLSASTEELNDKLAGAGRETSALEQQIKTRNDRVAQLEIANQKLRNQNDSDAARTSQFAQFSAELQEINRRRETYLNAILRRYKDVTEQYRNLYGILENRRPESPAVSGADLSRIQNSVAMAEEDMRQLNGLNAQAARLQKKLAGK
jgi:predicted nuclease with TOPRIM domain